MNKKNYMLIIISSILLITLPIFVTSKNIQKEYNELQIDTKIDFFKLSLDKVLNNISDLQKDIYINNAMIIEKKDKLSNLNNGLTKYNNIEDYFINENFNKINVILEKRNLKIITLNYLDKKFNMELLIKDQNDLDELKEYKYNINKVEYINDMFLINMTVEVI